MKVIIISEKSNLRDVLKSAEGSPEVIRYDSPLKAMDNMEEIEPDVILFDAIDFPRHWKPFLAFLHGTGDGMRSIFLLLAGPRFSAKEASEAAFLGVNRVVHTEPESTALGRLGAMLAEFDKRRADGDGPGLLFAHPVSGRLVSGHVADLPGNRIRFVPDEDSSVRDLEPGLEITGASLRRPSGISTVALKVETVKAEIQFTVLRALP